MKTSLFLFICLIIASVAIGQEKPTNVRIDIEEVEVNPPQFTGIENYVQTNIKKTPTSLINEYLSKTVVCPDEVLECQWEGTEVIQFTVTPEGNVTNFIVVNSVCRSLDEEVIRALKTTDGMWKPGSNSGKPTAMEKEVSLLIGNYSHNYLIEHFTKKATAHYIKGGRNLIEENNPQKALKHFNAAFKYLPTDKGILLVRGLCHYELGNEEKARMDWNRIASLGGMNPSDIDPALISMKGYNEVKKLLAMKTK